MSSDLGPSRYIGRHGSSPHIPIGVPEDVVRPCVEGLASASPVGKKKGGLLKNLKRIGVLITGSSSRDSSAAGARSDSDPSQRNGLAHALSTPELATAALASSLPTSMSKTPYIDISRNNRLAAILRGGSVHHAGSPPPEPHSPCSPFPVVGRHSTYVHDPNQDCSLRCGSPSVRCNVQSTCAAPVAIEQPPTTTARSGQQALSVGTSSSSPFATAFSPPCEPSSIGLERLDGGLHSASSASTSSPSVPYPSTPDVHPSLYSDNAPTVSNSLPPVCATTPATTMLAINPALPGAMQRRTWCLEDYSVIKRLYKGSSASVYKATCLRSGSPVALKVYFLTRVPRNVVHMIKREIELHSQLVHPHVAQLHAAFLDGSRIVLVQEYAARGDLFHILRQLGGRMTEAQVSELVMRPFLDALAYLHSHGVCHRDIKPENILFTDKWVLKLADFGVSINLHEERAVTRAGTIDYMAPEVCRCPLKAEPEDNKDDDSLAYTSAVDVWAAGVLAYELLVGFPPMLAPPQSGAIAIASAKGGRASSATRGSPGSGPDELHFPTSVSMAARRFIMNTVAENPGDRPTAQELLKYEWIAGPAAASSAAAAAVCN